jgi:ankyrin repeat protein
MSSEGYAKVKDGESPLHIAVNGADRGAIEKLLAAGADIDAPDNVGYTPLFYATGDGNLEIAELLILHGANVNACADPVNGVTPLLLAQVLENSPMETLLRTYGATEQ